MYIYKYNNICIHIFNTSKIGITFFFWMHGLWGRWLSVFFHHPQESRIRVPSHRWSDGLQAIWCHFWRCCPSKIEVASRMVRTDFFRFCFIRRSWMVHMLYCTKRMLTCLNLAVSHLKLALVDAQVEGVVPVDQKVGWLLESFLQWNGHGYQL